MSVFLLDNKDFESKIVDMPDNLSRLQLLKTDDGDYAVIKLIDQRAYEMGVYSKDELVTLWNILTDTPANDSPKHLEYAQDIINRACEFYGVTIEELNSKLRELKYVRRRKLLIYILHCFTRVSQDDIKRLLNYKARRNVVYHIREVEKLLSDALYSDETYKYEYNQLLNYLKLTKDDKKTTKTDGH